MSGAVRTGAINRGGRRLGADLAAGFGLLTRLPVGWLVADGVSWRPGRAAWCYPLAGAVVGLAMAGMLCGARALGLPPLVSAGWCVLAGVLLTGALHEDGLADTADGFGGGRTAARRLEIMRDSRIGSFGAVALGLALVVRIAAIAALGSRPVGILVAAGCLSRAAMLPMLRLRPARPDGLGHGLGAVPAASVLVAAAIAVSVALWTLPPDRALGALAVAALSGIGGAWLAGTRIGGRSGDVLGAVCVVSECLLLSLLSAG